MLHVFDASGARPSLQWSWLTLSGRDARDFLHRLTTVHVNSLEIGQGAPGFFLNPQGKVRAFFQLWRVAPDSFAFEFDAGATGHWKEALLAAIDQYTFAEKFEIVDFTESTAQLSAQWLFVDPQSSQWGDALGTPGLKAGETCVIPAFEEEFRVCHHGHLDFGRAWISVWARPAQLAQWIERTLPQATRASPELLEQWRIQALRPRVDREITEQLIPLEAGLTDALAQGKGCYPGQEVIERITSLGAPPRRLVRLDGQGVAPAPGEALFNLTEPPVEVGQVTSVAKIEGTAKDFSALAFVRKMHAKDGLEVRFGQADTKAVIMRVAPYA